jgi:hypothetical protein
MNSRKSGLDALTLSRTGFSSAGRYPSNIADREYFALALGRVYEDRILSRSHEAVIGVFDVETFPIRSKDGVGLKRGCSLKVSDFVGNHGMGKDSDERNLILH